MNHQLADIDSEFSLNEPRPFFTGMLVISLALHVICAAFILGGGARRSGIPSVNYLDLTMSELASAPALQQKPAPPLPMTEPPEEAAELPPQPVTPPSEVEQLRQNLQQAVNAVADQPEALQKVSFGLGLMNGHFGTLADGKSLRDDMREYYLSMLRTINEKWWVDGSRFEGIRGAIVNIVVARNGEIINAQIIQSSGNPAYDRAMLKSLKDASPVPPLPAHFENVYFTAPIRFNAPLNFLSSSK